MKKIDAIVFDMDGLIFDSERVVQRTWNEAGEVLGYGRIGEHIYYTLGFNQKRRTAYFKSAFGEDFPMERFNQLTRKRFQEIEETEGIRVMDGVRELLEYWKEQGLRMAVATSSRREYSMRLLTGAGIWEYLDGGIFGDMVENAKPDPEIYIKACAAIGADPAASIALEDSPAGIQSSYAAGMIPIMIPDLTEPSEEIQKLYYKRLGSLYEVMDLLKQER